MTHIIATYEIESPVGIEKAASVLAGEQSTGTFVRLAGETDELRARSAAKIEQIEIIGSANTPSLPCKLKAENFERGNVTISWPIVNFGNSLPNLLATIAGNLFELSELSAIRLLNIEFPIGFVEGCPGTQFGISGTRRLAGVAAGPMIGTIIKPSVGMNPEATAKLVTQLANADIDFIKDDELQANGPHCPFRERVHAVMAALNHHEDKTGKRVMYAFNMTDDIDTMRHNLDFLEKERASCAMVSLFSIGLSGLIDVRQHSDLPIHGHRNGWGLFSRSPEIGISFVAWQKLWRLAGADHLHVNGLANKFTEPDHIVVESARAVQTPIIDQDGYEHLAMPVYSSAQTIWQMAPAKHALGNNDFLLCAGGGIMSHPDGPGAGVTALRQAADAAEKNISIEKYAEHHPELKQAIEKFTQPEIEV